MRDGMGESAGVRVFRVVNAHSGRTLDEFQTEQAAEVRAMRELERVGRGTFRIEARDPAGGPWKLVRDISSDS
jgi:hypothetical protein